MGQERMGRLFEVGKTYKLDFVRKRPGTESVVLEGHLEVFQLTVLKNGMVEVFGEIRESGERYALRIGKGEDQDG